MKERNGTGRQAMEGTTASRRSGKYDRRSKRSAAALCLALTLAAGAWAGGGAERSIDCVVYKDGRIDSTLPLWVNYYAGATTVTLGLPNADYAVLKETREGSVPAYSNPLSADPEAALQESAARRLADQPVSAVGYSFQVDSESVITSSFAKGQNPGGLDPSLVKDRRKSAAVLRWKSYGARTTYELTWAVGSGIRRLTVTAVPEFVSGERKLFELPQYKDIPYERKALSLLAKLFPAGELESRIKGLLSAGDGASLFPLNVFDSVADGTEAMSALNTAKGRLKGSIARHFLFQKGDIADAAYAIEDPYKFPTIVMDGRAFEQLIGGTRSPYLMGYFTYLYLRGKPALSYPAQKRLWEDKKGAIAYDWRQYQAINESAGNKLAEAALRYLSGGVEYAIFTKSNDTEAPNATGRAFPLFGRYKSLIESWIAAGDNGRRSENYLPSGYNFLRIGTAPSVPYRDDLRTPFGAEPGNPLPYAPYGIDTPRSFAFKMVEQLKARQKLNVLATQIGGPKTYRDNAEARIDKLTSTAPDIAESNGGRGYAEAKEFLDGDRGTVKPFLPGAYRLGRAASANADSSESDYSLDQTAGVDSVGLLVGALSMIPELDGVADAKNRGIGSLANAYSMLAPNASASAVMADGSRERPALLVALGLDAQGTPAFHSKGVTSRLKSTGATLTWSDLERMTVLVPDISLLRKGDLIAGRDKEGRPHIGIVVGIGWNDGNKPSYGSDAAEWYDKVYIVSVRRGLRVATVGTWGNTGNTFGGFTMSPEEYQIRRLTAFTDGTLASVPPDKESWEAFDEDVYGLNCEITFAQKANGWEERWIPNTGEWLVPEKITIKGNTVFGTKPLEGTARQIRLLAPLDAYADPTENDSASNVKNNKGTGLEFGGIPFGKKEYTWLARARRNEGDGSYRLEEFNPAYMNEVGTPLRGHILELNGSGNLHFDNYPIGLRPIEGGVTRPGDDFILRFALAESPDVVATAREADRVAVYDKKLLWRANLYIQENGIDWNDQHPWVGTLDEPNEWNYTFDGSTFVLGNGRQTLNFGRFPWTPIRSTKLSGLREDQANQAVGDRISNKILDKVSYDINSAPVTLAFDSPFDFIFKLTEQQKNIQAYYGAQPINSIIALSGGEKTQNELANWLATDAPFDRWKNYRRTNAGTHRPYLPGLGLLSYDSAHPGLEKGLSAQYNNDHSSFDTGYGAGTDCVGFVQRSASYRNSLYQWPSIPQDSAELYASTGIMGVLKQGVRNTSFPVTVSDSIVSWNDVGSDAEQDNEVAPESLLNRYLGVIPGDIVYYETDGFGHIGVVQRIDPIISGMTKTVLMNCVHIVESVFFDEINYVTKTRDPFALYWRKHGPNGPLNKWHIVRLRTR